MDNGSFPALFRCADTASNKFQSLYLWLIGAEYGLLLIASILSISAFTGGMVYTGFAVVLLLALGVLLLRSSRKPEQDWYGCRAMAESVKTLSWRYMMKASPYTGAFQTNARRVFLSDLKELLDKNGAIANKIDHGCVDGEQITAEMDAMRELALKDRKQVYLRERVADQQSWYRAKAEFNRRAARRWVVIGVAAYLAGMMMAVLRIQYPQWQIWPIEPVLVFASAVVGWMQIKKFNELAAAYTVTATEIGLIKPTIEEAQIEDEVSDAVNEAELAFSREHTLWIARQTQ